MATTFTGLRVQDTYNAILKIGDNTNLTGTAKLLSDGFGNSSAIYLSTTSIGIGVTPSYQLHTSGNAKIGGNLIISGNLTVNGTLTYLNVIDLEVKDPLIKLATDNTANSLDIGFFGKYVSTGTRYKGLFNDASDDKFKLFLGTTIEPGTTVNTSGNGYTIGTLVANLEGNVTGGTISGTTGSFTGLVTGIAPTSALNFATKKYVDDSIPVVPGTPTLSAVLGVGNTSGANNLKMADTKKILLGDDDDVEFFSNSAGYLINKTGNLYIENLANDRDISFICSDGNNGSSVYLFMDGSVQRNKFFQNTQVNDNVTLGIGSDLDLNFKHDGSDSYIRNTKGNLNIYSDVDNGDITFNLDNGASPAVATVYMRLDGGDENIVFAKPISGTTGLFSGLVTGIAPTADLNFATKKYVDDNIPTITTPALSAVLAVGNTSGSNNLIIEDDNELRIGSNSDFKLYHNQTNTLVRVNTGDLIFNSFVADGDIKFNLDNGADPSAPTEYMRFDGGILKTIFSKTVVISNNLSPTLQLLDTNNNVNLQLIATDINVAIGTYSAHPLIFVQNTGTVLTIDTSKNSTFVGNVSVIGTGKYIEVGSANTGTNFGFIGWNTASKYLFIGNSYSSAYNEDIKIDSSGNTTFGGDVGLGGTGLYTTLHSLNIDGTGLAIKNNVNGSNNNWSHITNSDTASSSNLVFTTGSAIALTLAHNTNATFGGRASLTDSIDIQYTGNKDNDAAIYVVNDSSDWGMHINKGATNYGIRITADGGQAFGIYNSAGVNKVLFTGAGNGTFAGNVTANNITLDNILLTPAVIPAINTPSINLRNTNNEVYFQAGSANIFNFIKADYGSILTLNGSTSATFAGSVGIKTAPSYGRELLVKGEISALAQDSGDNQLLLAASSTQTNISATYGSSGSYVPLQFETGGAIRLYIDSAGDSYFNGVAHFKGSNAIVDVGSPVGCAVVGRNHAYDTLELKGYGGEMMIGSQNASISINYRTCNNNVSGHTPTHWYWRAGSSTSFSNHYMGQVIGATDMRAPIFYDLNDTTYYGNFGLSSVNSTAVSLKIRQTQVIGDSSVYNQNDGGWGARLIVSDNVHARIDVAQDANSVRASWYAHTGSLYSTFGTETSHSMRLISYNATRQFLYNGYSEESASYRAPIFYDSNDTAYYIEANGTSIISSVRIGGSTQGLLSAGNVDRNLYYRGGGSSSDGGFSGYSGSNAHLWQLYGSASNYGFLNANWGSWDLRKTKNGNLYLNNQSTYYLNPNSISIFNDTRSNIYYDQNNTTYYLDPSAGTSLVTAGSWLNKGGHGNNRLQLNYAHSASDISNSGTLTGWASEPGITYNSSGIGGNINVNGQYYGRQYNSGYGAYVRFDKGSGHIQHWATTATAGSAGGQGSIQWYNDASGNSFSTTSSRAPIFYDLNNTGYFLDPQNKSLLYSLKFDGYLSGTSTGCSEIGRNHAYNTQELKGYGAEFMIGAQNTSININYRTCNNGASGHTPTHWYWRAGSASSFAHMFMGQMVANTDARAPIFYDLNNTAFFVDPGASTSARLSGFVKIGNSSTYNTDDGSWGTRLQVASNVHARIDVAQDANAMRASWFCHTGHSYSWFGTVTSHGMYLNSYNSTRQRLENGYSEELASYRAPLFYDSNNTAYYADLGSSGTSINAAGKGIFGGDLVAFSDRKLKTNIKTLDGNKVLKMRGVSFDRIDNNQSSSGVIAQELQEVAPELVNDNSGTLGVAYGNITGYLIEAIKNQQKTINELNKRLTDLENN